MYSDSLLQPDSHLELSPEHFILHVSSTVVVYKHSFSQQLARRCMLTMVIQTDLAHPDVRRMRQSFFDLSFYRVRIILAVVRMYTNHEAIRI